VTLSDKLEDSQPVEQPEITPRTEYDGSAGFIQTGPLTGEPNNHEDILREFGYDPDKVQIFGHPKISKWQQRARIRGTSDYETTWLTAYKFTIAAKGFSVDLPGLYAEIRRTKIPKNQKNTADASVVVCWADVQVGKVDHLGGLTELLLRLEAKRVALEAYLRNTKFNRIVVADVGDIIEGFSNIASQHRTNSLSLMDQVDVAATELWKTLQLCAKYAPVDVLSIPSNHCAWRRDGKSLAGKPTDDWGLHINKRLERAALETKMPMTFHRPTGFEEVLQFDIGGTTLGLAHGHQVSSPDQIKNWWAKMSHAGVLNADILLTGHFHFASLRPSGRDYSTGKSRWHIQAPTLDNGSSWWKYKQGEDGDPALAVFRVTDEGFDISSFALL
jgi:hypothetical protein